MALWMLPLQGAGWLRAGSSRPFPWVPCLLLSQSPSRSASPWTHKSDATKHSQFSISQKISLTHKGVGFFFFFAHFQCVCSSFKCEGAHHPCRVYSTLKKFEVRVRISRAYGRIFSVHVREMHKQNTHVLSIYWKSNNKAYAHTHRSTVTLKPKVLKTSYAFG